MCKGTHTMTDTTAHDGFTLIELLVRLAILAILLGIGVPAFDKAIASSRRLTYVNQLVADLNFARSQAITRSQMISLCAGEQACNGSSRWSGRILIFLDANLNGQFDAGDDLLQISELPTSLEWSWSNFRNQPHMSFTPDGTTHSLNGTFTLCRDTSALRTVVTNITGRVRLGLPDDDSRCR